LEKPIENNDKIEQIFGTVINGNLEYTPDCLITSFKDLEIKGIIINGDKFMKAVYAWDKISIEYALTIWEQNINFFPSYNYILYNNSVMPKEWFDNNLEILGHYENVYLKYTLDGGGKEKWYIDFDVKKLNMGLNTQINEMKKWKNSSLIEKDKLNGLIS
jgi:hypothetical protein